MQQDLERKETSSNIYQSAAGRPAAHIKTSAKPPDHEKKSGPIYVVRNLESELTKIRGRKSNINAEFHHRDDYVTHEEALKAQLPPGTDVSNAAIRSRKAKVGRLTLKCDELKEELDDVKRTLASLKGMAYYDAKILLLRKQYERAMANNFTTDALLAKPKKPTCACCNQPKNTYYGKVKKLRCGHSFHVKCLKALGEKIMPVLQCPTCRVDISYHYSRAVRGRAAAAAGYDYYEEEDAWEPVHRDDLDFIAPEDEEEHVSEESVHLANDHQGDSKESVHPPNDDQGDFDDSGSANQISPIKLVHPPNDDQGDIDDSGSVSSKSTTHSVTAAMGNLGRSRPSSRAGSRSRSRSLSPVGGRTPSRSRSPTPAARSRSPSPAAGGHSFVMPEPNEDGDIFI